MSMKLSWYKNSSWATGLVNFFLKTVFIFFFGSRSASLIKVSSRIGVLRVVGTANKLIALLLCYFIGTLYLFSGEGGFCYYIL